MFDGGAARIPVDHFAKFQSDLLNKSVEELRKLKQQLQKVAFLTLDWAAGLRRQMRIERMPLQVANGLSRN